MKAKETSILNERRTSSELQASFYGGSNVVGQRQEAKQDSRLAHMFIYTVAIIFSLCIATSVHALQIAKVSGDNQTVPPGTSLTLAVRVSDDFGAALPGVSVTWVASPGAAAALGAGTTVTSGNGQATNTVTINFPLPVAITATAANGGSASVTFNESGSLQAMSGLNEAQRPVAAAINRICPTLAPARPGLDLSQRCSEIVVNAGSTPGSVNNALAQITPAQAAAGGTTAINVSNTQFANIAARLAALRGGATGINLRGLVLNINREPFPGILIAGLAPVGLPASSNDSALSRRLGVFLNGALSFGDKDATGRESGFDFDTKGITAGMDYRLTDRAVLGLAFGYAHSNADFDASGGGLDTDAYNISLYGIYNVTDRFYVDGIASLGWNNFDSERRVRYSINALQGQGSVTSVNQTMRGKPDGTQTAFSMGAGYDFNNKALTFGPYARLNYAEARIDGFREKASDPGQPGSGWRLEFEKQIARSMTSVLGGQVSYAISTQWAVLVPQARLEWEHEFNDTGRKVRAKFVEDPGLSDPGGTIFAVPTDDQDRDYFNLGVGLQAVLARGKSAFVNYETLIGHRDLATHNITVGIRFEL